MKRKLFTLLTLLLTVCSGAWGDDTVLFTTDFKESGWNSLNDTNTSQEVTINGTSVTVKANNTSNLLKVDTTTGTLTWGNRNFSNKDCYLAIPVTGVNGELTISVANGSSNTRFTYAVVESITSNPGSTSNSSSANPSTVTVNSLSEKDYYVCIGRQGSGLTTATSITITTPAPTKTATSESLKSSSAVKVGATTLTKDAATSGYGVSSNTITLTNDIQYALTPSDIKLVKTITYDAGDPEEAEVDVDFNGTVTDCYYIGTASIGLTGSETEYTVRVKKDVTPTLTLSSNSASITLKSYEVVKINHSTKAADPVTVTLTGTNLKDGDYDVSAEGLSISPTSFTVSEGSVEQEFSILTTASTAASTNIVFTAKDTENNDIAQTFTLNMTRPAKRSLSQSVVTSATTWDWTKAASEEILLTKNGPDDYTVDTDPKRGDEFLMATLPEVTNDATFNSQALKINTQYVKRTGNYFQGNSIKFNTTLSGNYSLTVWFSNTNKRDDTKANRRYLYIDGSNTDVYTLDQNFIKATTTLVLDGSDKEIVINAYTGEDTPAATMVRISKIVLAPLTVTLNASGYATYSAVHDFTVTGATAYKMALDLTKGTLVGTAIETAIPAGEGVLLMGEAGATVSIVEATGALELTGNSLKGTTKKDGTTATVGSNKYYVLSGDTFKPYDASEFAANKAYFEVDGAAPARAFIMTFDEEGGETTGIAAVKSEEMNAKGIYTLSGQRVAQPAKGLYIINGKKVILK